MNPLKLIILAAAFALSACAPASPMKENPAPPPAPEIKPMPELVTDSAQVHNQYESPKVDVLFVMDNSLSMQNHQEKLVASIDRFAESFIKNADVDFHVGVVKVYDSIRFSQSQATFVPNGQLLGKFVSRSDNTVNQLKDMLKIGVLAPDKGGPEFEEIFSPVKAALTDPMLSGANAGFYRQDAHLAVIMITDANDASPNFDETNLAAFLYNLKGKRADKFSVYGVLAIANSDGQSCKQDPSGAPTHILNLLNAVDGHKFSLCDRDEEYGRKLALLGSDITAKVTFSRVVELTAIPDPAQPMTVMCEGKEIPKGPNGWAYDPRNNENKVVVASTYANCRNDQAVIQVTYAKVKSDRLQN